LVVSGSLKITEFVKRRKLENEFMSFPHSLKELILLLPNTFEKSKHTDFLPKTLEKLVLQRSSNKAETVSLFVT
jgi:hypothetical protein